MPSQIPVVPLQSSFVDTVSQAFSEAVAQAIAYLPVVLGALLVLLIGYIIGRILGGLVTRVAQRIGLGRYTPGSSDEHTTEGVEPSDDHTTKSNAIAQGLGKIVSYYVYFVALVAAANILEIDALSELLADLGAFLPVILGALIVLIVGFIVAWIVGDIVADVVGGFGFGSMLRETPLERLSDETGEFGRLVGTLVTYYIYLLTLLAVADILDIEMLSTLLNTFSAYIPALVGGLIVLLVGIWVGERVGSLVSESDDSRLAHWAGLTVKVLIYYITVTIALSTIGFNTAILTTLSTAFITAFFGALALALAIGIGVAVGLGGQNYVAENIDSWGESVRSAVAEDESRTIDD